MAGPEPNQVNRIFSVAARFHLAVENRQDGILPPRPIRLRIEASAGEAPLREHGCSVRGPLFVTPHCASETLRADWRNHPSTRATSAATAHAATSSFPRR